MGSIYFKNLRLYVLTLAIILIGGITAIVAIPRQEDPRIAGRSAIIVTPFPGASAVRVETLVTEKIEAELRELEEIETLTSSSRVGLSVISVELKDKYGAGKNDEAFSRMRDAIADAVPALPPDAFSPMVDDERHTAFSILTALVWRADGPPVRGLMRRHGETLQDRLRNVPGTELVRLYGAPPEEVTVRLDRDALTAAGLTPMAVSQALTQADAKISAGQLRSEDRAIVLEVEGGFTDLDRIGQTPLAVGADGRILRLSDVADLSRGVEDPPGQLAYVGSAPAVVIGMRINEGLRIDKWAEQARAEIAAYRDTAPLGLDVEIIFDQSDYTEARLDELIGNLQLGIAIVISILLVTLGWRGATIVSLSLPLTLMIALFVLNLVGGAINQISVIGLIVALGLLVDNAIVTVFAISTRIQGGMSRAEAVREATGRLWLPLLASTVTTVLSFMPIVLMPGMAGEFVGPLGLSVIFALIASYAVAMTLVAGVTGRWVPSDDQGTGWWSHGVRFAALGRAFDASLRLSLRHPVLSMMTAAVLPVVGFMAATALTEQFFPPVDRDQFHIEFELPRDASIQETAQSVLQARTLLLELDGIDTVNWFVGRSAPAFYYNLVMNRDGQPNYAQAQVEVTDWQLVPDLVREAQRLLDAQFPQARILVRDFAQGPPAAAPVEMRILGPDVNRLRLLGEEARHRLSLVPSITHSSASMQSGDPKLWWRLDEEEARRAGLGLRDIAGQMDAWLEGRLGGSMLEGREELPVRVRVPDDQRANLDRLASLDILPPADPAAASSSAYRGIPLTALGVVDLAPEPYVITRRNGERVNNIYGYIEAGTLPQTALEGWQAALDENPLDLPPGYRIEFGGDAEERDEALGNLASSLGVLIGVMVAIIVLTNQSYRLALIIFAVAAQAIGLGLLSVALCGYPLGFVTIVGTMGLVGLAINAAIIIIASLRADPQALEGDPDAIRTTVIGETSRHITSTTLTTVGGFLPLILAGGAFWPPFAVAIAGGTALTSILSFYFVPAAFRVATRFGAIKGTVAAASEDKAGPETTGLPQPA